MKHKLAILASHPIQYQAPLFQKLTEHPDLDVKVYFKRKPSKRDAGFGRNVKWDIPLLDGYRYCFLKGSLDFWIKLKRDKYDVVFIYGWNSLLNWLTVIFAKLTGIKVLLQGENPLNQEFMKPKWKRLVKKFIFGKILFGLIGAFLYIGEENRKFYKHYGVPESKLFFMPYAVDNNRFTKEYRVLSSKYQALRDELKIGKDDVAILFVGKLIPKKRPMDLLKAFEFVVKGQGSGVNGSQKRAVLFFIGDGELRPELEGYAKKHKLKNVHFLGFKNQTKLPKYYAMADIFVLPSQAGETWGLVVNEAMCFGLPVVVSDVAGCVPDLVRQGENGFIFPVGDIGKLTERLVELIKKGDKRKKFGNKSLKIIQGYNYDKDVEGILSALGSNISG